MVTLIENFRAVFYAPFYAAQALGAYAAEGVEVRMTPSSDPGSTLASLNAGAGDVSWGGPLRILKALDHDRAGGYVGFCEVVGRDPFFLVGRTPQPQFRLRDLGGKRLGIVTEVPTPWICLQYDLRNAGIDPAAMELTAPATMAQNTQALAAGDADVIQVFQPYAEELVESGAGHVWYAAAARGATSYTSLNTTRAFLERSPDVAAGMTRAMHRTLRWIASHDGAALAARIGPYFPSMPSRRLAACIERYKAIGLWNTDPVFHREGVEWLREAMLAAGYIRTRIAFEECVDNHFASESVARGAQPL
ncbi:MAG: ABC transporter substrate-binding protein [Burkholderiales bacterium]|nr:ABC transporter substrate-binding protein [Burkholderiales bacterium]